jgi:hypothetical protein
MKAIVADNAVLRNCKFARPARISRMLPNPLATAAQSIGQAKILPKHPLTAHGVMQHS